MSGSDLPDLVIEFSIDGGTTWRHGKTVARWVGGDRAALSGQRAAVRSQARADLGNVGAVATRVLSADDPRGVLNQPPAGSCVRCSGGPRRFCACLAPCGSPDCRADLGDGETVTVSRLLLRQVLTAEGLTVTGTGRGDQVFDALRAATGQGPTCELGHQLGPGGRHYSVPELHEHGGQA